MQKLLLKAALGYTLFATSVSATTINGQVESPTGKLTTPLKLNVQGFNLQTQTDIEGRFSLELPPGRYRLEFQSDAVYRFVEEIQVNQQNTSLLKIALPESSDHKLVITSHPLQHTSVDMATPSILLSGEELISKRAATIGEILQQEPGLNMSSFGPAVARPVIRGLGGDRVQIAINQMLIQDASTNSADHDVGIEPLLADQVEVIKGPATLFYGSGAIGGIVNVTDRKINSESLNGLTGGIETRLGDSATGESSLIFTLDAGHNNWNWHFDGYSSQSDDLTIPGPAESSILHAMEEAEEEGSGDEPVDHQDEHDEEPGGILENSSSESLGGSLGLTYHSTWGYVGGAVSVTDKTYGVPGHHHEAHEEEHEDEGEHEDEHEEGHEEEAVKIDMQQTRYDLQAQLLEPIDSFEKLTLAFSLTDYQHKELEGEEIGTQFENKAWELKSYLQHDKWSGWNGIWGIQATHRDFSALGEEAFVVPFTTKTQALYVLEEKFHNQFKFELGARYEKSEVNTVPFDTHSDSGFSFSTGVIYSASKQSKFALNYAKATRFAGAEELYSDGPHLATQSYEVGNQALNKEISNNLDLSYRYSGENLSAEINLYFNQFNDFIYGQIVSEDNACVNEETAHEAEEENLQLICYQQQDATFKGIEFSLDFPLGSVNGHQFKLNLFGDYTQAKLKQGDYVPRIPPLKVGLNLSHDYNDFSSQLSWISSRKQDKIASNELPTEGFDLLDLELAYRMQIEDNELFAFFKAKNLLDEEARDHSSFLKDLAPRAGRNFLLGLRYSF